MWSSDIAVGTIILSPYNEVNPTNGLGGVHTHTHTHTHTGRQIDRMPTSIIIYKYTAIHTDKFQSHTYTHCNTFIPSLTEQFTHIFYME